jgi:hypothetical protein
MERRNFRVEVKFTASEKEAIQTTMTELGLDPKKARSELIRFGTLFFCGLKVDGTPEMEKYLWQLIKTNIKAELITYLGLEKGVIEKLKKFWEGD